MGGLSSPTRRGSPRVPPADGSADEDLEGDIALGAGGDGAGEVPTQLGRAGAVLAGGEDGPLGPLGAVGDVFEPGQEAVDDRDGGDRRVAHVAELDGEGEDLARFGHAGAD